MDKIEKLRNCVDNFRSFSIFGELAVPVQKMLLRKAEFFAREVTNLGFNDKGIGVIMLLVEDLTVSLLKWVLCVMEEIMSELDGK